MFSRLLLVAKPSLGSSAVQGFGAFLIRIQDPRCGRSCKVRALEMHVWLRPERAHRISGQLTREGP